MFCLPVSEVIVISLLIYAACGDSVMKHEKTLIVTWLFLAALIVASPVKAAEEKNPLLLQAAGKLSDPDPMIRREALIELGDLKDAGAVPYLLGALGDSDPYVRGNAAYSLGRLKSAAAVAPLIEILEKDLHPQPRKQAALALARLKDPKAVPAVIGCLKDAELQVRMACAEAVGVFKVPEGVAPLITAASGGEPALEKAVVTALGRIGDPAAFDYVSGALERAPDTETRSEAVRALGGLKRPEAVSALKKRLKSDEEELRVEAALALARLGDDSGKKVSRKAASSANPGVRRKAEEALRRIRKPE